MGEPFVIWVNGAFGAGKTTLAQELAARHPDWMLFDPEEVGYMARAICGPYETFHDFQDLAIWSPLVVETARQLRLAYHRPLIVPMTITDSVKWAQIRSGIESFASVHAFRLMVEAEVLEQRLLARGDELGSWPHLQISRCVGALADPQFGTPLDAGRYSATELAENWRDWLRST